MSVTIRVKRGTATQWAARTTPLLSGEFGYDLTNKIVKIGDGTTLWSSLPTIGSGGGGGSVTTEEIQDIIHDTLTNFVGINNNITVTYDDDNNYIVLDTGPNVVLTDDLTSATGQTLIDANAYTDLAIAGLSDTVDNGYIPIGQKATAGGVASLGLDGYIPDTQISPDIARDSEIITSYNDLTDKPAIVLGAVKWTANHYQLNGGENTRYLAGDIVWDGGSIYVANFDNESLPTTNTQYWSLVGPGNRLNIDGRDIPNILWDNILEKPTLFDGDYGNLTNKPSIPADISDLTDTSNLLVPFASPTFTGTVNVDNLEISGDLTFSGTATQINSTETTLSDPMIYLGEGNAADINDLGFVASFDDGTYQHAGLVRDASDHKWKLFKGVTDEPTNTVNFAQATLDDLAVGSLSATSATIGDVSNTEIQYLNGVTSDIQSQIDSRLSTDAAAIIYLGKIEAGLTYAPKASPTFTGTVTFPANTSGANFVNIPNSALSNSSITINGSSVSLGGSTTISTSDSTKLNITDPAIDYYITNAGAGAYVVNGVSNGTIYFEKGKKYRIHVNATGHPFWIQTVSGGYSSGNIYNTGITNNGTADGHIIVELAQDAPQLYYACQFHSSMAGSIVTGITTVIPLQTGNSGKFLTTDGSAASWSTIDLSSYALLSNPTFTAIGGDEGGQINLALANTNTTLSGSISLDIYQNRLRIFESSGNNRGAYLDIANLPNGVSNEILTSPSQSGQSGKFLTTNGTTTSWVEVSGGGGTAGADIMNIMEAW